MAIIGILAALLIPNAMTAMQRARQKGTMKEITTLATYMMDYTTDRGSAPAWDGSAYTSSSSVYTDLVPLYAKSLPVKDPWGNNYLIYSGSSSEGTRGMKFSPGSSDEFIVMSLGRDGEMDSWSFDEAGASFYEITSADDYNNDLVSWNGMFVRSPKTK